MNFINIFVRCQSGVTLIEYGVALAVAIGLGAAAFIPLSNDIVGSVTSAGETMVDP